MSIKTFVAATVTAIALLAAPVSFAQDAAAKKAPSEKQLAQRDKMKSCNADAKSKSLAGSDRKAFMKTCLSGGAPDATAAMPAPASDQKTKMKTCNADAKEKALKGDDRKAFMKTCLSAG